MKNVLLDDRTYSTLGIKEGGMGRVWLLEEAYAYNDDPIYTKRLAAKTFDFMADQNAVERELNIWISLDHPSILPLRKIGRLNYRIAAVMPIMEGSVQDLLDAKGALGEQLTASLLVDVVDALDYAWRRSRTLHLDLKPQNILLSSMARPVAMVADWGISRLAKGQPDSAFSIRRGLVPISSQVKTMYSAGTPIYMAPERFSGEWELTPTADIYSLGLLFVQLCSGILPFKFGEVDPISEIFNGGTFANSRMLLRDCSKPFERLCLECMNPNPRERISELSAVSGALRKLL